MFGVRSISPRTKYYALRTKKMAIDLKTIARRVLESASPDLHLRVGEPPVVRLRTGELVAMEGIPVLTIADIDAVIHDITTEAQFKRFAEAQQLDFSYHEDGLGRFRVNIFQEKRGPAIAFRVISDRIPTMDELGLGDAVKRLLLQPKGLVLVTGATGMGKSTTLASMIDYINQNRKSHIITIEDPIEFIYKSKEGLVTQREVNVHTRSFSEAISGALRQDPDVVMIGEMRDLDTIAAAITLAETGTLVFSTLHTSDAAQTVNRIIDVFPAYQQQQIRTQLSSVLKGVISQTLLPRANGDGRVAAHEILLMNDAVRNCIARGETHQLYSIIQLSGAEGMVLMDSALEELCKTGYITAEQAIAKASDVEALEKRLQTQLA